MGFFEFDWQRIGAMRRHIEEARGLSSKTMELLATSRAALELADAMLILPALPKTRPEP